VVNVQPSSIDNEGYVKDHKINFISLNDNIFTNKKSQDETFIPQHNNVILGDNLNKHLRVNGYRYKNKNDKIEGLINENKLNINEIAKLYNDINKELLKDINQAKYVRDSSNQVIDLINGKPTWRHGLWWSI